MDTCSRSVDVAVHRHVTATVSFTSTYTLAVVSARRNLLLQCCIKKKKPNTNTGFEPENLHFHVFFFSHVIPMFASQCASVHILQGGAFWLYNMC